MTIWTGLVESSQVDLSVLISQNVTNFKCPAFFLQHFSKKCKQNFSCQFIMNNYKVLHNLAPLHIEYRN